MDRRAFIKALGIATTAFKAAGMLPTSPGAADDELYDLKAADFLEADVVAPEPLDAGEVVMLPTEGLEEVMVVEQPQQMMDVTSYLDDGFERFVPTGLRGSTNIEMLYVTDEPIQMLMQPIVQRSRCRLEAFGSRVDGLLVLVSQAWGDSRGRIVTRVEMRATGYCEYDADRFDHRDQEGIPR